MLPDVTARLVASSQQQSYVLRAQYAWRKEMAAAKRRQSKKAKSLLDEDTSYSVVFDLMTEMIGTVSQRQDIPAIHIVAPLADILAAVSLRAGGEAALAATVGRLGLRLAEASVGEFPPR